MDIGQVVILALVQALTEFLPVSSSGHLGLAGFFFGFAYQGLDFDLALHFGTLIAVLAYYRRELIDILRAVLSTDPSPVLRERRRLGWGIALATVPALIAGLILSRADAFVESLRMPALIATNLIVFGVLLGLADRFGAKTGSANGLSLRQALYIGLAQVLALVPGVSRSGITISAGLALGLSRAEAARYTFLMSVPITLAATAHGAMNMFKQRAVLDLTEFALGATIAAIAGVICIHWLLKLLRTHSLMPFVWYRIGLGTTVFALLLFG